MGQVQIELLLGPQQLKPLGVGLHQAVLNAVVHHLDKVARAAAPHVAIAPVRAGGQGLEQRLQALKHLALPAHHQAVAVPQAPDAAAGAHVQEIDAALRQGLAAAHALFVVGVAPVDHRIARRQGIGQGGDGLLRGRPRRGHHPHRPGRGQPSDQPGHRGGARRAQARQSRHRLRAGVVDHHPVPALQQPLRHVAAHAAQTDHSHVHAESLLGGVSTAIMPG